MGFSIRDVGAVNDMPRNWKRQNEANYRIYNMWIWMIRRCYNKELQESQETSQSVIKELRETLDLQSLKIKEHEAIIANQNMSIDDLTNT